MNISTKRLYSIAHCIFFTSAIQIKSNVVIKKKKKKKKKKKTISFIKKKKKKKKKKKRDQDVTLTTKCIQNVMRYMNEFL